MNTENLFSLEYRSQSFFPHCWLRQRERLRDSGGRELRVGGVDLGPPAFRNFIGASHIFCPSFPWKRGLCLSLKTGGLKNRCKLPVLLHDALFNIIFFLKFHGASESPGRL